MERQTLQLSITSMLGLVACVAINIWLFRVNIFLGLFGLYFAKHLAIAHFCHIIGVNRRKSPAQVSLPPQSR